MSNAERVLRDVLRWAESRCPCHEEQPNPCPLCGASVENLEPCKSAENTLPRRLLGDIRAGVAEGHPAMTTPTEPATATEQEGAHFDTCTEPECRRCRTPPYARGDMKHSGIGFYPTLDTSTPAPEPGSGEGLVERLRHRGQRWAAGQRGGDLDNEAATALTTLQQQLAARDALLKADNWAALAQERLNTIVALEERATAAEAERDALRAEVARKDKALSGLRAHHLTHVYSCGHNLGHDCDCGLQEISAALRPSAKGGRE